MMDEHSREGWTPDLAGADPEIVADAIDEAFDYRGDVTITTRGGQRLVGYLFNRRRDVAEPFVQVLPAAGGGPEVVAYADIQGIAFTGKDTASGNSYAAWLQRKEAARTASDRPAGAAPSSDG